MHVDFRKPWSTVILSGFGALAVVIGVVAALRTADDRPVDPRAVAGGRAILALSEAMVPPLPDEFVDDTWSPVPAPTRSARDWAAARCAELRERTGRRAPRLFRAPCESLLAWFGSYQDRLVLFREIGPSWRDAARYGCWDRAKDLVWFSSTVEDAADTLLALGDAITVSVPPAARPDWEVNARVTYGLLEAIDPGDPWQRREVVAAALCSLAVGGIHAMTDGRKDDPFAFVPFLAPAFRRKDDGGR